MFSLNTSRFEHCLKEISPGISLEGMMLKLKLQYFGQLMRRSWLIGKDSDGGRDWGQEEKGTTEDEMAGWHHWLNGRESEWTPGVGDGQGGLVCCDSWGGKESDTTERLDWTELNWMSSWGNLFSSLDLKLPLFVSLILGFACLLGLSLRSLQPIFTFWFFRCLQDKASCC